MKIFSIKSGQSILNYAQSMNLVQFKKEEKH